MPIRLYVQCYFQSITLTAFPIFFLSDLISFNQLVKTTVQSVVRTGDEPEKVRGIVVPLEEIRTEKLRPLTNNFGIRRSTRLPGYYLQKINKNQSYIVNH